MLAVTAVACVGEKVHTQEMLTERERETGEREEEGLLGRQFVNN